MLTLQNLTCGYHKPEKVILDQVSLGLPRGAFVCVVGRNGAGKSTLLRTISGLQAPMSGEVRLNDTIVHDMTPRFRAQQVSVVTTERIAAPGLTVKDVIELGRQPYTDWQGKLSENDQQIIATANNLMATSQFVGQPFDGLSDGERQRVMIARALVQSAELMVMDEITAFLDLPGRVEVMALLRKHARQTGKIILLSSHDLELSLELADQLWIVDNGKVISGRSGDTQVQNAIAAAFDSPEVVFDCKGNRFRLETHDSTQNT